MSPVSRNQYRKDGEAEPNLAYDSLQLGAGTTGTCSNNSSKPANGTSTEAELLVGRSSVRPESTIFIVLAFGVLLLSCNVWFWVCFVVRKRSIICCMTNDGENKKLSEEPELSIVSNKPHQEPGYQRRIPGDSVWYDNSDNLSKTDSYSQGSSGRFGSDDQQQAISLISSGHVTRSSHQLQLYDCSRSSRTLPREQRRCAQQPRDQFQCADLVRAASQEQLASPAAVAVTSTPPAKPGTVSRSSMEQSRSNLVEQQQTLPRPKLTTFCHAEQAGRTEQHGKQHFSIQTVAKRVEGPDRFLPPESV